MSRPDEPLNSADESRLEPPAIAPLVGSESQVPDDLPERCPENTVASEFPVALQPPEDGSTSLVQYEEWADYFESETPTARPAYELYSPRCVAWAAFWGGLVGGAIVLSRNYWVLRHRFAAVFGLLVCCAGVVPLLFLPVPRSAGVLTGVVLAVVLGISAEVLQGHLIRRHEKAGGSLGSGLGAFGFGLLGLVLSFGIAVGLFGIASVFTRSLGERLAVGRDDEIYYSGGATRDDAQRLGAFLKSDGFFDDKSPQSAVLAKSEQLVLVSFFLDNGDTGKTEVVQSYEELAATLSGEVFDGQPVQILFRDGMNRIRRRLEAKTAISPRAWQKQVDAAERASVAGNYAEAEGHYRSAVKEAEKHESLRKQLVWSLNNVGNKRLAQGLTEDIDTQFQRAITIAETVCGKESYEVGYALDGLARWERKRGNLSEAEILFRRALAIREKLGDGYEEDRSSTLAALAIVLIAQEKFAPAEEFQQQNVTRLEKLSSVDPAKLATNVRWLGWLQWQSAKYADAKKTLEKSQRLFEQAPGIRSDGYFTCLWQLGAVCHALGDYDTAEKYFRRGIELLETSSDPDTLLLASFREVLAVLLTDQARFPEAEQLHQQALDDRERELGADHVEVADSLGRLGSLAAQLGRFPEAESQLKRAIGLFEKSPETERRRLADCLHDLACVKHQQGRFAEAEPLYRKALAIREEVLGREHDRVAATVSALSELYSDRRDFTAAEPLARRAHELAENRLGKAHPFLVRTLHRLALVQFGQRKLDDAEETLRRALKIGGQSLGAQHPYLAESQNTLAAVLMKQERMADAEPLLEQALKSFEAVLGPAHPQLVGPLNNLGLIYEQRGRDAAAEQHLERALKLSEGIVGKDHPDLLPILHNYANVLRKLGRPDEARELERRSEIIRAKTLPEDAIPLGSPVVT